MKGSYKFGFSLLAAVILILAIIQASQKVPVNWNKTFNPKDKIPFGTYVIRHELKNIFPENQAVTPIQQSLYTYFNDSATLPQQDLIFVGLRFLPGKASLESLYKFVAAGNNALICTWDLEQKLKDSLKLSIDVFNSYHAGISFDADSFYYESADGGQLARFGKNNNPEFFNQLDSGNTTILGYLKRGNIKLPNFIKVRFGKGNFLLQLTPDMYSNYFMLNSKTYPTAYASLHHLQGRNILWYDGLYDAEISRTPLRYILSQPALRYGWYLLLATLLLFLIFKSRREQAAIPIVKPEENLSLAFAQTIGSLYYENGQPGNMISKKIKYFLHNLKKEFRFDATDIASPEFRKQAVLKLKIQEPELKAFFDELIYYQNLQQPGITDLKNVQALIEDFKQKIKS